VGLLMESARCGLSTEGHVWRPTAKRTRLYGVSSGCQRLGRVKPLLLLVQTEVSLSTERQLVVRGRMLLRICINAAGSKTPHKLLREISASS
jgi:hypothetical protein